MKTILSILLTGLCLSAFATTAEIEQARVTLPYTELLNLLAQADAGKSDALEKAPRPPVDVLVQSATYRLNCTDPDAATLDASFSVTNLSDQWQSVFLVEASEAIRSLDPPDAKIVQMEKGMCLLIEPKISATVTIGLQVEPVKHAQSGRVVADFFAVGAAKSLLKVVHASEPSALLVTGAVGANPERTEFSLPSAGGPVQVKLYKPGTAEPTPWNATSTYWVRDEGGVVEVACHLRLRATDGGLTNRAELMLENPASIRSVEKAGAGPGPRDSVQMMNGGPLLHLEWPHDEAMMRELLVRYTVPMDMTDGGFSVPLVEVAGARNVSAVCFVSDFDGIEISPSKGDWMEMGRLPQWIDREAGAEPLNYIRFAERGSLELSARLLPRLKTASATVQSAEYFTELVVEGGMLHRADVTVEHRDAAEYRFTLPEGGKLLSSTVNGRPVDPLLGEGGMLIYPLPKPDSQEGRTRLGYVFTAKGEKMNPVEGSASMELPRTPLFVHKLSWAVQLPEEYQATALEGNVVIDAGGARGRTVRLSKQICDDETPFASLYYTRKDLNR